MTENRTAILSPHIRKREQFGTLLNDHGLVGTAVEIGTHRGEFAHTLLSKWSGRRLCCIDPWQQRIPGYERDCLWDRERMQDYQAAKELLAPYGISQLASPYPSPDELERVYIIQSTSAEAVNRFERDTLDFVYLDGNHEPAYIQDDIESWFPLLHLEGILAGHDWNGFWADTVQPAVLKLALRLRQPIYYVIGDAASWYLFKP